MVAELILKGFFHFISPILDVIPDLANSLHFSFDAIDTFFDYLSLAFYIIPVNTFYSIFKIIITVQLFRVLSTIIKTIWQLIPFA